MSTHKENIQKLVREDRFQQGFDYVENLLDDHEGRIVANMNADMAKSTYDTNDDGGVGDSDKLEGQTLAQVRDHAPKSHAHLQSEISDFSRRLVVPFLCPASKVPWVNQPLALTEPLELLRNVVDLTDFSEARLVVNVVDPGAGNAVLAVQGSVNLVDWVFLDGSSGPSVSVSSGGLKYSAWVDIPEAYRREGALRLVGSGGDGAADPSFGLIALHLK